jgi:hypothetical protein
MQSRRLRNSFSFSLKKKELQRPQAAIQSAMAPKTKEKPKPPMEAS